MNLTKNASVFVHVNPLCNRPVWAGRKADGSRRLITDSRTEKKKSNLNSDGMPAMVLRIHAVQLAKDDCYYVF